MRGGHYDKRVDIQEAEKHFSTDSARACMVTAYAKAQGTHTISLGACRWWLRSPGSHSNNAAVID